MKDYKNNIKSLDNFQVIMRFFIMMVFLYACVLQVIVIFQRYYGQNQQIMVTYYFNKCLSETNISKCVRKPSYKNLVVGFLASRGLGCKFMPKSFAIKTLFECVKVELFIDEPHFSSYLYVDDLPFCQ